MGLILNYGQKFSNFEKVEPIKKPPQLFREIPPLQRQKGEGTLSSSSPLCCFLRLSRWVVVEAQGRWAIRGG